MACGVLDCLGHPDRFLADRPPLGKRAHLGQAPHQAGTAGDGEQESVQVNTLKSAEDPRI